MEAVSKFQNEPVGWGHVRWVVGQVRTAKMAETMSGREYGWSMAPGHLEPPGTAPSYLLPGLEVVPGGC